MPIRPPNLDDRRYEDILAEARALIPQYCPEWTNLGDADPGMTLVQLFSWMTELTIYRLNRVPDKTYIHFLNFIGEERKRSRPAIAPATFSPRNVVPVEVPAFTRVATRQREGRPAQDFLTVEPLTVHDATPQRVMAVRGGARPAVRELSWSAVNDVEMALAFGSGRGMQFFELDEDQFGPDAYTPYQYLYVGDDDLRLMDVDPASGRPPGRLSLRRPKDGISLVSFFRWEYPTDEGWLPVPVHNNPDEVLGMPDEVLTTFLPGIVPLERMGLDEDDFPIPESVSTERYWIRGTLEYERWLARRMQEDLDVFWQDDWAGDRKPLNNVEIRGQGRTLEFYLQDCPPIRDGWRILMQMIDRGLPGGRSGYLPRYRWSYRRGETWEEIPEDQIRIAGPVVEIRGPLREMATDGYNLRAERVETAFLRGMAPDLEVAALWTRPVEIDMFVGDDPRRVEPILLDEAPWSPFQINAALSPTIGRKWYVGSDLFENRAKKPVLVEIEVSFEVNGELIAEPEDDYLIQLTYRAEDNWRVVYSRDKMFAGFTFAKIDPDGAKREAKRKIRLFIDPAEQLKGLARHEVGGTETTWLRFELIKSNLTHIDEKTKIYTPIVPRIHAIRLGADKTLGDGTYEHPMPSPKVAQVDHREHNRRLTRCVTRAAGRLGETWPYFDFVDLDDEHQALYLQFDKPLPPGARHAIQFRCRGQAYLPDGVYVEWELLSKAARGKTSWRRLLSGAQESGGVYDFTNSGELSFALPDVPELPEDGFWIRGRFVLPEGMEVEQLPALPPITHVLLNTVGAVNLVARTGERYSGMGVPHQVIELGRKPIFLHPPADDDTPVFPRPELFDDIKVWVQLPGGEREEWAVAREGNLLTAGKDDKVFVVDPVDGVLIFGNGIRGRMLPVGTHNLIVERYHVVPGGIGNVGPGALAICEKFADQLKVTNLLPASGGRDAESVEEILRRGPSLLTSRDRAVTRQDFEIIAGDASAEVARAACPGRMGPDGEVEVVVLPHRREGERVPDPFLASGLRDHVEAYLERRCLINVQPRVRLATFLPIDISIRLRLRPNSNLLVVRETAERWVLRFLDPYVGGLDRGGWPFGGTLYAQDFGRMIARIPEIRHVVDVEIYDMGNEQARKGPPGWDMGEGLRELALTEHDLFVVRRVRIQSEEEDL